MTDTELIQALNKRIAYLYSDAYTIVREIGEGLTPEQTWDKLNKPVSAQPSYIDATFVRGLLTDTLLMQEGKTDWLLFIQTLVQVLANEKEVSYSRVQALISVAKMKGVLPQDYSMPQYTQTRAQQLGISKYITSLLDVKLAFQAGG